MGFIIILPFGALAAWSIFAVARWLWRGGYDRQWWKAFGILGCIGLALGIWFTFVLEFTVANVHLKGFPIPVFISNREKPGDPWARATMPAAIRAGAIATNVLAGVALCLAPIAVAAFIKENQGKLSGPTRASNSPP